MFLLQTDTPIDFSKPFCVQSSKFNTICLYGTYYTTVVNAIQFELC